MWSGRRPDDKKMGELKTQIKKGDMENLSVD